ncbi:MULTISPECIES: FadR/GntR family transcriptional regulator [Pseudonocardia]|uniref:GntR family transcriptional regulator n=2 Tax=Pseudonocardia TaxID=1847 RepID=A0ABQ0RTL0_9PSEU|nr:MULTISPECIES: FadR/GntR family transcriptional regulator [Pseudonocardia]OSY42086.1 putative L-lactate dehydrogenase operon regulatory protein [Pseudonocardia autotrophica]TDN75146.1 GntR family transcriptional regulator [Pseudonocardia autotrophica]BBF99090.1 GntR family transcriptional regulator [Pseudonocardia autotrophica]GEC24010.1 GntR family transcriptional regulator [Pseudonocardia saturnea]
MPLVTARRGSLVDQVITQLRNAISSGQWPVGHRIPAEAELTAQLEVGRNTVREAVRALAHGGLLEVRQGDGTYVRATSELSGALRTLCGPELREVLEVRRTIEVEAARLAAARHTDEDLALLRRSLTDRDVAVEAVAAATRRGEEPGTAELERAARADTDFHLAVVRCSGNSLLVELYRGVVEAVAGSVVTTMPATVGTEDDVSHTGIVEAIEAGDVERAAREAGDFLQRLIDRRD